MIYLLTGTPFLPIVICRTLGQHVLRRTGTHFGMPGVRGVNVHAAAVEELHIRLDVASVPSKFANSLILSC